MIQSSDQGLDSLAYPGCQVLIARKGIVVLNKCYGFHLYDSTEAVSENDLWDLASVTKVSAATPSLMLLNDRGLFDPDRTLGYYLPWYRFSDKGDMVTARYARPSGRVKIMDTVLEEHSK